MPRALRIALAAILALVLAPVAQAAVAPQPPFDREAMKETYKPIGFFKPGDPLPSPLSPPGDATKVFNPSGHFSAFDTNVYESLNFPSRQAGDTTDNDPPGTGDPLGRHGFCKPPAPDSEFFPTFLEYGKCDNHQLEWLNHYERTMKEILAPYGVVIKRYRFESPGSGQAGRPGNNGATSTPGGSSYNISATVPGADNPDEQIIVSGHFDFTDSGPAAAWDSQEGHAEVIRMAKIMADYWKRTGTRPSATVKFMPWDQEETGTVGSTVWVRDNVPPGDEGKVRGYFNVDPCAGAYPAYYHGNPAERIPMVLQLADPANAQRSEDAARIKAFNDRAVTIIDEFFADVDDTVEVVGGVKLPLYTEADRGEIIPAIGGLLLFSSDYRNFEAIGAPFMNLSPDMFGPKADPAANSERQSNEGIAILHTPRDNNQTLNQLTGPDQTGTTFSDGWMKGMELCAQLESRYMLQPEMGGAQTANMDTVAYFEALPNEAIKRQRVTFDATGSYRYDSLTGDRGYAGDLTYEWDFGDGTSGTGRTVQHAYAEVGKYTAKLTVRSGATSDTMTLPITVIGSSFQGPELAKPEAEDADGTFPLSFEYKAGQRDDLADYVVEEATDATSVLSDDASDLAKGWVARKPDNDQITPWSASDANKAEQVRQPQVFRSAPRSFYTGVPAGPDNTQATGPGDGTSVLDIKEPVQLPKGDVELTYWSDFANDANDSGVVRVAVDTGSPDVPPEYLTVDTVGKNAPGTVCSVNGSGGCPARGPQFQQRRVDLSQYAGRKVRLQFIYQLGKTQFVNAQRAGWYVDDIAITAGTFKEIGRTPEKTFAVKDRPNGSYAYRVKAAFSDGVTSAGSNVETVRVTNSTVKPGDTATDGTSPPVACVAASAFRSAKVKPKKRGLRFTFARRSDAPVKVEVFRTARGRSISRAKRIKRFTGKTKSFTWKARGLKSGVYYVRYTSKDANGAKDVRKVVVVRKRGRFKTAKPFLRRAGCGLLRAFSLGSPAFGGKRRKALVISYRLGEPAKVKVAVFRGKARKAAKRFKAVDAVAGKRLRVRFPSRGRKRGLYRVRITATTAGGQRVARTLHSRLL
ncbi:MAG TPA: M28 family peptidase [Solirubrobacteraceae bacterium]